MSDSPITCGNCGAVNEPRAQFCLSCGALLAAYVSPTGSRPGEPPATEPETSLDKAASSDPSSARTSIEPQSPSPAPSDGEADRAPTPTETLPLPTIADSPDSHSQPKVEDGAPPAPIEARVIESKATEAARPEPEPVIPPPPDAADEQTAQVADAPVWEALPPPEINPLPPSPPPTGQASAPRPPAANWDARGGRRDESSQSFAPQRHHVSSTPPQTLITIGVALMLASCILGAIGAGVDMPFFFDAPAWCAFPLGLIMVVIGIIQLVTRGRAL